MRNKPPFYRLAGVMLFDHVGLNMTVPLFALIFFDAHSHLFAYGVTQEVRGLLYGISTAIPNVIVLFIAPVISGMSDSFGRKPLLLFTITAASVFSFLAGMSVLFANLSLLIFSRAVQGFSRTNPIAQAMIGDMGGQKEKLIYMAKLQSVISIAAFVGPVLGGYCAFSFFETFNFSLVFFAAGLFALVSACLASFFIKETLAEKRSHSVISLFRIMKHPNIMAISLLLLLCQLSWSTYYQFIPVVLKVAFHFSSVKLGWFIGLIACWLAVATLLVVPYCIRFLSLRSMLIVSIWCVLIGLMITMVACVFGEKYVGCLWVGAIPTAMGDVIAYSCLTTLYSNYVGKEEQGGVMGVCFIIVSLAWAFTSMIGGILSGVSVGLPLILSPIGVIFFIFLWKFKRDSWARL